MNDWITDNHINFFMELFNIRDSYMLIDDHSSNEQGSYFCSTYFVEQLMGRNFDKYDFDKVDPTKKKFFPNGKSPLKFTRIFIPVYNNGIHWSHVVVDLRRFSVTHYDSGREYNSNSAKIVRGISKFLYACDKSKTMFAESKLELIQSH